MPDDYRATTLTDDDAALLRRGDHLLFGISPFNSYFSQDRITTLARWAAEHAGRADFVVVSDPTAYTLAGAGNPPAKAVRKARTEGRRMVNRTRRALADVPTAYAHSITELMDTDLYQGLRRRIEELFRRDEAFRAACTATSRAPVTSHAVDGFAPGPENLRVAAHYLLDELPLWSHGHLLFDQPTSLYVYHNTNNFLVDLYRRKLPWQPSSHQGFLLLEDATES
ncbi:tRNA-dependent cyclodipeptide synthase [Streptomyces sp. NPDC002640]